MESFCIKTQKLQKTCRRQQLNITSPACQTFLLNFSVRKPGLWFHDAFVATLNAIDLSNTIGPQHVHNLPNDTSVANKTQNLKARVTRTLPGHPGCFPFLLLRQDAIQSWADATATHNRCCRGWVVRVEM